MGLFNKKTRSIVGLDIEPGFVAAAEFVQNGRPVLVRAATTSLGPGLFHEGEVVDVDGLSERLKTFFRDNDLPKRVRLGVASQKIAVRVLELPAIEDPQELDAAIRFQAQEELPMPLEQAVLDHRLLERIDDGEGGRMRILVVAARRDSVEHLLAAARRAGLQPELVDLSAFAMVRALYLSHGPAIGVDAEAFRYGTSDDQPEAAAEDAPEPGHDDHEDLQAADDEPDHDFSESPYADEHAADAASPEAEVVFDPDAAEPESAFADADEGSEAHLGVLATLDDDADHGELEAIGHHDEVEAIADHDLGALDGAGTFAAEGPAGSIEAADASAFGEGPDEDGSFDGSGYEAILGDHGLAGDGGGTGDSDLTGILYCYVGGLTNLAIAVGQDCIFNRVLQNGLESMAATLAERRGLTLDHAREWLRHVGLDRDLDRIEGDAEIVREAREVLDSAARRIADEIRLSIEYYHSTVPNAQRVEAAVLAGPGITISGLSALLEQELALPVESRSMGRIEVRPGALDGVDGAHLTIATGLAIDEVLA